MLILSTLCLFNQNKLNIKDGANFSLCRRGLWLAARRGDEVGFNHLSQSLKEGRRGGRKGAAVADKKYE